MSRDIDDTKKLPFNLAEGRDEWFPLLHDEPRIPAADDGVVDVMARRYNNKQRRWEYKRFVDVHYGTWILEVDFGWQGRGGQLCGIAGQFDIPADWEATHWRFPPEPPREAA